MKKSSLDRPVPVVPSSSNSNSMRFFVSRHLGSQNLSRPMFNEPNSSIWTTGNSATYEDSSYNGGPNFNHPVIPPPVTRIDSNVITGSNLISGSNLIFGSNLRPNTIHRTSSSFESTSSQSSNSSSGPGNQLLQPRDRKPLQSPEYEIPSISSRASSSCGQPGPAHLQQLPHRPELKTINSSYHSIGINHHNQDLLTDSDLSSPNQNMINNVSRDLMSMISLDKQHSPAGSSSSNNEPNNKRLLSQDHNLQHSSPTNHSCKSNQSECHIYSHIYDSTICDCVSCDRLNERLSNNQPGQLGSSVLRNSNFGATLGHNNQRHHELPLVNMPSWATAKPDSRLKKNKLSRNKNQLEPNLTLATLHKLNNYGHKSPDHLNHLGLNSLHHHNLNLPSYLSDHILSDRQTIQLSPYSTTGTYLPALDRFYSKDRRKKCLILSAALAVLVLLILLLVTSFVVFIISSYQSLYSPEAANYVGTSTPAPPTTTPGNDLISKITNLSDLELTPELELRPPADPPAIGILSPPSPGKLDLSSLSNFNLNSPRASQLPPTTAQSISSSGSNSAPKIINNYDYEDGEQECRQGEEWRCNDGLCIPKEKHCDGHFNCFDHSDETTCDPCPTHEGWIKCGDLTSCLPPSKKCDGIFNCWDGADEANCDTYSTIEAAWNSTTAR